MSLSKIRQANNEPTDKRFCWNSYIMQDVLQYNVDKKWFLPIIQGYVGQF